MGLRCFFCFEPGIWLAPRIPPPALCKAPPGRFGLNDRPIVAFRVKSVHGLLILSDPRGRACVFRV